MAEKRENSVLFSLRELRQLEDDRVTQEASEAKRREEAEKQAKLEAERQARDDAERQRRETEETERRRVEEAERRTREEQLRIEEAERRARVDAQMKLEEQRLKLEIEARARHGAGKKPVALIVASIVMFVVVVSLGAFAVILKQRQDRERKASAAREQELIQAQKDLERRINVELQTIAAIDEDTGRALDDLKKARDDAGRQALLARIEKNKQEKAAASDRVRDLRQKQDATPKKPASIVDTKKCKDPNDPLCGI